MSAPEYWRPNQIGGLTNSSNAIHSHNGASMRYIQLTAPTDLISSKQNNPCV